MLLVVHAVSSEGALLASCCLTMLMALEVMHLQCCGTLMQLPMPCMHLFKVRSVLSVTVVTYGSVARSIGELNPVLSVPYVILLNHL